MDRIFLLVLSLVTSAYADTGKSSVLNRLQHEKSPYLLQHQANPVNWYPWGEEAFETAKRENKPIFLSIGYSTCYWCHVMEKDSFELEEVAEVLNKNFISIKVDREERPDVDKIYMDIVMGMTGHGGWPMSVFMTPDRQAFYGGTFFWKDQFIELANSLAEAWEKDREKIAETGLKVVQFLNDKQQSNSPTAPLDTEVFRRSFDFAEKAFDATFGGFGRAPKFPPSVRLQTLLRIHKRTGNQKALEMAENTLDKMARGGLYDQLGGGFHRYSTDAAWLVPHFEKMLYDNALLAVVYLEAYQLTKKDSYKEIAEETLNYVLRDMTGEAFYSAEDAGEVGAEGEFYVWNYSTLKELLSETELKHLEDFYGVSEVGNFENKSNILHFRPDTSWDKRLPKTIEAKLRAERDKRRRPHKDDKILTSWNGLMISAFAKGYLVVGDERYLEAASKAASFIKKEMFKNGKLLRRYRLGEAKFSAYLDDYAFLIQGLIALYEASSEKEWLDTALELQAVLDNEFWDSDNGGYFFTDGDDKTLIIRQKDFSDGAIPSGNGIACLNLLKLFDLTLNKAYKSQAEKLLGAMSSELLQFPAAFASSVLAFDYLHDNSKELVVVSDKKPANNLKQELVSEFLPNVSIAFGEPAELDDNTSLAAFRGKSLKDGKPTIYVCEEGSCKQPTTSLEEARKLLNAPLRYEL